MKKTFVSIAIAFLAVLFVQCKPNNTGIKPGWEELYEVLSDVPDNNVFSYLRNCEDCANKDSEVKLILIVKDSLDASFTTLRHLAESARHRAGKEDPNAFTKTIIQLTGLGTSIQETSTAYMIHVIYLQSLASSQPTNPYESAKKALISTDKNFVEVQKTVISGLSDFEANQKTYNACLKRILNYVSNQDFDSATDEMESDEFYSYLLSCAKMLRSLYDFELSRALAVKESINMTL